MVNKFGVEEAAQLPEGQKQLGAVIGAAMAASSLCLGECVTVLLNLLIHCHAQSGFDPTLPAAIVIGTAQAAAIMQNQDPITPAPGIH